MLSRAIKDPKIGDLIGLKTQEYLSDFYPMVAIEPWRIINIDESILTISKRDDPDKKDEIDSSKGYCKYGQAVWTTSVPDISKEALTKIYHILSRRNYSREAYLFEVGDKDNEGNIELKLLNSKNPEAPKIIYMGENFVSKIADREIQKESYPKESIILLNPKETVIREDDKDIIISGACVKIEITADQAKEYIKPQGDSFQLPSWNVGDEEALEITLSYCYEKHLKDKLIVISFDEGTLDKEDLNSSVLLKQGSKLFWEDCIIDSLYGVDISHGVFIGEEIDWYNAGDDGAEWEASWSKATVNDMIENGISLEDIKDHFEYNDVYSLTMTSLKDMFLPSWRPILVGNEDDAREWIKSLPTSKYEDAKIEEKGNVISLIINTHIEATAAIIEAESQTRIVRWVSENMDQRCFDMEVQKWKDQNG